MPANLFQRVGDFLEMRREYRQAALIALRKREGLPSPVDADGNELETRFDEHGEVSYHNAAGEKAMQVLWAGTGKDGKPGAFAVGQRRGTSLADADQHWGDMNIPFEILETSEKGQKLEDELRDLVRDAAAMALAEQVSHGAEGEQAPGLVLDAISDAEVEAQLQAYSEWMLKRE